MGIRSVVRFLLIVASTVVCGVACSDQGPTSPSAPLTGTWSGVVVDSALGSGTARLVLEQREGAVTGTFTTVFGGVVSRDGASSGTVAGAMVTMFFTPSAPLVCGAGITLSGTLSITLTMAGNRLTGSYAGLACGGAATGTLDLAQG